MEYSKVLLPNNWRGLPIYLSRIVTTDDNSYFRNNDIVACGVLKGTQYSDYVKNGDFVQLESTNEEFVGHVFRYELEVTQSGTLHHFLPTSKFLNAKEIIVKELSDITILSKVLFIFHELSEDIEFSQYEE
ncbi:hypothetical protein [Enterococcus faecalis]|uniref:hypothetical protein n=1 Tax=Enterococcus faecalis TaxID=1351 RepID=UPI00035330E9|nr:hypothetical protein [Enterococcus faecalis]EPI39914.1 hypothetical protein D347_00748 [Enterococcus faecalis LA3B-2]